MWATGAPKTPAKAATTKREVGEEEVTEETTEPEKPAEEDAEESADVDRDPREVLKELRAQAKRILSTSKRDLGAKRKQDLRAFSTVVKKLLSRSQSSTILTESLEAQFAELQRQLQIRRTNKEDGTTSLPSAQDNSETLSETPSETAPAAESMSAQEAASQETVLTDGEYNELYDALRSMQENPVDDSKPYATPWMPRDFMSAFAFIPRFLEVNHKICAAVYLRHPVARPGLAEVPTPFPEVTNSTAFAWYLRRR